MRHIKAMCCLSITYLLTFVCPFLIRFIWCVVSMNERVSMTVQLNEKKKRKICVRQCRTLALTLSTYVSHGYSKLKCSLCLAIVHYVAYIASLSLKWIEITLLVQIDAWKWATAHSSEKKMWNRQKRLSLLRNSQFLTIRRRFSWRTDSR